MMAASIFISFDIDHGPDEPLPGKLNTLNQRIAREIEARTGRQGRCDQSSAKWRLPRSWSPALSLPHHAQARPPSKAKRTSSEAKQKAERPVVLPFTVLRCLDGVLAGTGWVAPCSHQAGRHQPRRRLLRKAGQSFYNTSPLDLAKLLGDQDHLRESLYAYIQGFSPAALVLNEVNRV
jgi:hypothetical protein